MEKNKRIVVVDDHPIFRMGIVSFLSSLKGYVVIAEGSNGEEALALIKKHNPDYIILDLDMPKVSGKTVVDKILHQNLPVRIIVLTAHTDPVVIHQLKDLKCVSILFKESAVQELSRCLTNMEEGKVFISPLCVKFLESTHKEISGKLKTLSMLNELTKTELKILSMIAKQLTTNQIAEKLHNSHKTIENHRSNISLKLGLTGANALLRFAIDNDEIISQAAPSEE
ncbi:MAG: response regulator transcription factor [Bacteroidales bacterium]